MQLRFILLLLVLLSFANCARVGRPTGGEKDMEPPISISASPDFESVNFKGNRIKIFFDEYIKFKDINKQLVVSPPLKYPPEITPLGTASKYISIKLKDTLKENTTYTFNFGNAIVDNSEGNPLKQFKYLFSTGYFIDSLGVDGIVRDAFQRETASDITVLIYAIDSTFNDSIIYKRKPDYVANTLDSIAFSITNVKDGKYLLLALNDVSKNMIYNPKEDYIGYLNNPIDIKSDSTYQLILFKETPTFAIKNTSELSKNHIVLGYEGSLKATVKEVVDKNKNSISFLSYKDRDTDSLHVWFKDVDSDSLFIQLKEKDSLTNHIVRIRSKEKDSLELTKNIRQTLDLRDSLFILSNIPIQILNKDKMELIDKDSVNIPFTIRENALKDKFQIDFNKKYSNRYTFSLLPSAITDFLGHENDSIKYSFSTKKTEDYGEIEFKISNNTNLSLIIELLNDSGDLVERNYMNTTKTLNFILLKPGNYIVRVIFDANNNQKWDTGNYLKKVQPEKVEYFNKEIELRANWKISEEFIID